MITVCGFDTSLTVSGCARLDLERITVCEKDGPQLSSLRWETWRGIWPTRKDAKGEPETAEEMRRRIRYMLREILALVPDRFDLAVVEGPAIGAKFAGLADERAGLRWMLVDQLLARGPVVLMAPKTRALLATGNGNAGKPAVCAAIRDQFPTVHVPDHNVADGVVLAAAAGYALGMPWDLTAKQKTAHARVAWPTKGM